MSPSESRDNPCGRLVLADTHVEPTLIGEKTLTARYAFERDLSPGQIISLETPDGEEFATAQVEQVESMTVRAFVEARYDGHQTYDAVDDLLAEMSEYYPDAPLSSKTPLTVIWYTDVEESK